MTQAHPEVLNRFQTAAFSPQPIPGNGHYVNLMFEQGAVPCSGKVPPVRIIDVGPADERLRSDVLPVLLRLRPHLSAESLQRIYRDGHPQGLRFTAVYEEDRCSQGLDLDSRVDREDAHRFYLREGPRKTAYHFARPVE